MTTERVLGFVLAIYVAFIFGDIAGRAHKPATVYDINCFGCIKGLN